MDKTPGTVAEETPGETETDNGDETTSVELTLAQELPKRRIAITDGERGVEVEGPDTLPELGELAERLWALTAGPRTHRLGFSAGSTLITDLAGDVVFDDPDSSTRRNR
jgi:hypothetical protein